ncbi:unnamed protein product, partial [Brenthis ino]
MFRLFNLFVILIYLTYVVSLSDVDRACANTYSDAASNDDLLGTWYDVFKFAHNLNLPPSSSCRESVVTRANQSEVQRYSEAYRLNNPYSFDDNPVLINDNFFFGMLMGKTATRFYVSDPNTTFYREDSYEARVYRRINDEYMLFHRCAMRGNVKWLLSKKRNPSTAELNEVIKSIEPEVRDFQTQRFCA